jgi:hypothetical protein
MRNKFTDYDAAKAYARELAAMGGPDAGITKAREFGRQVYNVSFLPKKENTFGSEMNAERVQKGD